MPKSEADRILVSYADFRIKFWKLFLSKPHTEKIISTDLFVMAISQNRRLINEITATIEVNNILKSILLIY
jgi:hypothetical protein